MTFVVDIRQSIMYNAILWTLKHYHCAHNQMETLKNYKFT